MLVTVFRVCLKFTAKDIALANIAVNTVLSYVIGTGSSSQIGLGVGLAIVFVVLIIIVVVVVVVVLKRRRSRSSRCLTNLFS